MGEFVAFDRKDGRGGHLGSAENPVVTVTETGVYFGADVWRDVLNEAEYVEYLTDAEDLRVGFRVVDEDDVNASSYSISEYQARAAPVWDQLGMDVDGATHVPLDTDSESFPVIDVSEFVNDGSDDEETDNPLDVECEVCGRGFTDERGKNIHKGRMHDDERADGSTLDHERVETAMDQVGVDPSVAVESFINAVDLFNQPFQVSSKLDMTRADVDDLLGRLDLDDALESDGDLARERFEGGSA